MCLPQLVANWVVTQPNFGIYDQLRSGIRFIDLRIATTTVVEEDEKTAGGTGSRDEATSDTHSDDASSKDNEKESLLDKDGPAALDKDGPVALDKDGPAAQDKDGESQRECSLDNRWCRLWLFSVRSLPWHVILCLFQYVKKTVG